MFTPTVFETQPNGPTFTTGTRCGVCGQRPGWCLRRGSYHTPLYQCVECGDIVEDVEDDCSCLRCANCTALLSDSELAARECLTCVAVDAVTAQLAVEGF